MSSAAPASQAQLWDYKDPDAILDYSVDWTPWLAGNTISSVIWTITSGTVVKVSQGNTDTIATIRLSGGQLNEVCLIICHVICANGEEEDQTCKLPIKGR